MKHITSAWVTTPVATQEVLPVFDRLWSGAAGSLLGRPHDHFAPRVA